MNDVYDLDFDYEDEAEEAAVAPLLGKKSKITHVWERDEFDFYVEPERVTDALLTVERFSGVTLDPCCGSGNIVRALLRAGCVAHGRDLVERPGQSQPWFLGTRDFLGGGPVEGMAANIVSNPPFFSGEGTEKFIRTALASARSKVAVFTDVRFLFSTERLEGLYRELPPARVHLLSPRVSCPPGKMLEAGGKPNAGTASWVWLVWDFTAPHAGTSLHWVKVPPVARAGKAVAP